MTVPYPFAQRALPTGAKWRAKAQTPASGQGFAITEGYSLVGLHPSCAGERCPLAHCNSAKYLNTCLTFIKPCLIYFQLTKVLKNALEFKQADNCVPGLAAQ